jgi:hypothetical protein
VTTGASYGIGQLRDRYEFDRGPPIGCGGDHPPMKEVTSSHCLLTVTAGDQRDENRHRKRSLEKTAVTTECGGRLPDSNR